MVKVIEGSCIESTDRIACNTLNTLLHREGSAQTLKLRTITDLCDRHGKEVEEYQEEQAKAVLLKNGFTPETGLPKEGRVLPREISSCQAGVEKAVDSRIDSFICEINQQREGVEQIPEGSEKPYDVESPDEAVVHVSLDGVLAKKQREQRAKKGESREQSPQSKKRPSVETSVAHIEVNGKRYILTAHDMRTLCIQVLAFLLHTGLLVNRQLILFSDGAAEIKSCVDEIFAFCRHHLVLDWFHLKKHCYELLSMILKSGKSNSEMRCAVRRELLRILWVGNVEGAVQFLSELSPEWVKCEEKRQELMNYLNRKEAVIACYAIRRKLGLRISSNSVEKANDLTVSRRQKHKGMSWSHHGSWHMAALTALYLNQEAETWHNSGSLSYTMTPSSQSYSTSSEPMAA